MFSLVETKNIMEGQAANASIAALAAMANAIIHWTPQGSSILMILVIFDYRFSKIHMMLIFIEFYSPKQKDLP